MTQQRRRQRKANTDNQPLGFNLYENHNIWLILRRISVKLRCSFNRE